MKIQLENQYGKAKFWKVLGLKLIFICIKNFFQTTAAVTCFFGQQPETVHLCESGQQLPKNVFCADVMWIAAVCLTTHL